jgi:hypothetical protein
MRGKQEAAATSLRLDSRHRLPEDGQVPRRRPNWLASDPWSTAGALCLLGSAVLLVIAWYDISGTADLYKQLPYLVSAGFSGLALSIVGSALFVAGRSDRTERRLAQLVDALTEAATPAAPELPQQAVADSPDAFHVAAGGRTYHRAGCLLLRSKQTTVIDPADIASRALTPCPVCGPSQP